MMTIQTTHEAQNNRPRRQARVSATGCDNPRLAAGARRSARLTAPCRRVGARRRAGFTLVEVLISLGIFGIGMICVAALFPVAAVLQKETADDILGTQSTTNARATIEAIGLTYFDASTPYDDDLDQYYNTAAARYPATIYQDSGVVWIGHFGSSSFYDRYPLTERSYPTTENDTNARDHFSFFFVRDSAGNPTSPSWQGFILVVERLSNQDYTDVTNGLTFGDPTGVVDPGTPYITVDGKTGNWIDGTFFVGTGVYYHPNAIGVETFTFETLP